MTESSLNQTRVLVTRPAAQAKGLNTALRTRGARVFLFPAIEIEPVLPNDELVTIISDLTGYDLAIFISSNAVSCAWPMIMAKYGNWPESVQVAAIGRATAQALQQRGAEVMIMPEGRYDSENLLRHSRLHDMVNQRVLIVRGVGGREFLADELKKRGAQTEYLEVYRRVRPSRVDPGVLTEFCQAPGYIVCTSNNGIDNLLSLADSDIARCLRQSKLVVISARMEVHARQAGFENKVLVTRNAGDDAIVDAIAQAVQ